VRIDFLSIFPEMFEPFVNTGIMRIASEKGFADFHSHDIRNWSDNKHNKVDDKPFGGGPGMVMKAEPVVGAVEDVMAQETEEGCLIFMTPKGEKFNQPLAKELSKEKRLVFVCGRYEGFDQRIFDYLKPREVSIGDFVLTGGELASMVISDAVVRLIPGVLGSSESLEDESFENSLLDYPHYTQPAVWRERQVPEILRSGNHGLVEKWRKEKALENTKERRPDLL
jgi:tRNA (guanine37-N1)-methyltransferase